MDGVLPGTVPLDLRGRSPVHGNTVAPTRADHVRSVATQLLRSGVAGQVFPGASACIAYHEDGAPVYVVAHAGAMGPSLGPITATTFFDLASVTKPIVAMAALTLVRDGAAKLDVEAQELLADVRGSAAARASLRRLLRHTSGLAAWGGLFLDVPHAIGSAAARRWMISEAARRPDESGVKGPVYSDLGYIVAGAMISKLAAQPLERVVQQRILQPLGIADSVLYVPTLDSAHRARFVAQTAATERCEWRGRLVRGEVHDENCAAMGGVAGHAGLFGTAEGVARFGLAMVDVANGRNDLIPRSLMDESLVCEPETTQKLGWDGKRAEGSSAGRRMGPATFGHLGFTGTSLWCDPESGIVVALLTNRVCPSRANMRIKAFRPAFHDAVVGAALDSMAGGSRRGLASGA